MNVIAIATTTLCGCSRPGKDENNKLSNERMCFFVGDASSSLFAAPPPSPVVQSSVKLKQFPVPLRFTDALNALSRSNLPDSASLAVPGHGCMPASLSRDRLLVSLLSGCSCTRPLGQISCVVVQREKEQLYTAAAETNAACTRALNTRIAG